MRSYKAIFREAHGYDKTHRCFECGNCVSLRTGMRTVYKCRKLGITGSAATDIRKKDFACDLFDECPDIQIEFNTSATFETGNEWRAEQ